ncbi:hypothetical protein M422DRAFT_273998 [Sphaerobolus stellatus SS14]|uniref:Uncharacterized protein n=1 Tax=Sphaerobolus stellatus (strain SS14) TaxID=990650 RepID=A0A0C9U7L3_SPHS4|nr:hypothetical protein M422DRAFT_273998 [Sphaerobolus stellatus SS14]
MSTTSKEASTPPPSSGTRNRKDATIKEDSQKGRIKDIRTAKAFLEGLSVIIIGEKVTIQTLILALQHLAQSTGAKQTLQDGMKAVALLLAVANDTEGTDELARKVAERIKSSNGQGQNTLEGTSEVVLEIRKATQEMKDERKKTFQGLAMVLGALEKTPTYAEVTAANRAATAPKLTPSRPLEPPDMT